MMALITTINILNEKYRLFQSHKTIYLHYEFLIKKGIINYVFRGVEIQKLQWFFENEGKLVRLVSSETFNLRVYLMKIHTL